MLSEKLSEAFKAKFKRDIDITEEQLEKITCELEHGKRVSWYFPEDKEFADEVGYNIREDPPFSGMVVALDDVPLRNFDNDIEHCIIVQDRYPAEKVDCLESSWITVAELLESDVVEIFEEKS